MVDLQESNIIEDLPIARLDVACVGIETTSYIDGLFDPDNAIYSIDLNADCQMVIAQAVYDEDGLGIHTEIQNISLPSAKDWREAEYVKTGGKHEIEFTTIPEIIKEGRTKYNNEYSHIEPFNRSLYEDRNKKWGKDKTYEGILKVVGRVYYKNEEGSW